MPKFKLVSSFRPEGDQPRAIKALTEGLRSGKDFQTLLGVTGSGKTFTMANVIEDIDKPTLVISHNKTLAAQLYSEFRDFFPENAVEYFVSYYDYYQPEAYIPQTDTYIEKDSSVNDRLDRLRLSATSSLMSRSDVIIVASVSCIYNLGSPEDYSNMMVTIEKGQKLDRDEVLRKLIGIQYERNDIEFVRGKIRVRGDTVDVFPAYSEKAIRFSVFGDDVEKITEFDPVSQKTVSELDRAAIYPAKHFLTSPPAIEEAVKVIKQELDERLEFLRSKGKLLEAQRLEQRTRYDIEMLQEIGYCHGVENYSRHLGGRPAGARPYCLIDYFPKDFLMIVDESHVTIPQIRGMYEGDRARKTTLVDFGFRLPSCLDNRPLRFDEFETLMKQAIFASATPSEYEVRKSGARVIEQVIRPTGLIDPDIIIKPTDRQVDDIIGQVRERAQKKERVLVTTLTKRMAEDLSAYLEELDLRVKYIHSDIDAIERVKILKELRLGEFDCLVGVNLLREGLDLPEVSLVAVLDADKEGFLRSETSLIQLAGRAARHINGQVIMYADNITGSLKRAIDETKRRRALQLEYNRKNSITPKSIQKAIREGIEMLQDAEEVEMEAAGVKAGGYEAEKVIEELEYEMGLAARNLQFEKAAEIRDRIAALKKELNVE
ncbi:MAG TPA: excinuclease ABC subunit UvrB [Candidatus Omnitrophota bacterium]|nr:excinuclease ABC subunit UvrB [Candidatus Omnitrophota bacterium]HOX09646.1 excinuclease ABC subunit UvrB [Candidatus Omnitrophota bacterium]